VSIAAQVRDVVERERRRFGAPGVAVALVRDGEVLLAEGFGARDLETGSGVTSRTAFPLASDTKALTAAALCLLAEQGRVDLDAPVRAVLPWFALSDPLASDQVSPRDLLCHRTGLPRHDLVWAGETSPTLDAQARAMRHLAPSTGFRQAWQYSNLAFNAAGHLTEQLTGRPWQQAVRELLLEPVGMAEAVFDPRAAAGGDVALPYRPAADGLVRAALPPAGAPGPSGGLVAHVQDVARWLLARLGGGPLSPQVLAELHTPVMAVPPAPAPTPHLLPMGYALGCVVDAYRGHRWVHHGGSLIGYSSDVGVAPDEGVGVAVLTNLDATSLPVSLSHALLDLLLDLPPGGSPERYHERDVARAASFAGAQQERAARAQGRPGSLRPDEVAGTYAHPAYGELQVLATGDGGLDVRFHGIEDVVVRHRDRDVWDVTFLDVVTYPVSFRTGPDGDVVGLTVPFEPAVAPLEFVRLPPPVPDGLVQAACGTYASGPQQVVVTAAGEQLVLTVPGFRLPLVHRGGGVFGSAGMSSLRVELVCEADRVVRLAVEPFGTFERAG
jgi:CubicO group peptidase (beta-lactamase class C family)